MIYVDSSRCTACGVCVDACSDGAIRIEDGVAMIDQSLCTECEICLELCPERALLSVTDPSTERLPMAKPQVEHRVSQAETRVPAVMHPRLLPALSSVLAFVGREIVPRALTWLLDSWDRQQIKRNVSGDLSGSIRARGAERDTGLNSGMGTEAVARRRNRWRVRHRGS